MCLQRRPFENQSNRDMRTTTRRESVVEAHLGIVDDAG